MGKARDSVEVARKSRGALKAKDGLRTAEMLVGRMYDDEESHLKLSKLETQQLQIIFLTLFLALSSIIFTSRLASNQVTMSSFYVISYREIHLRIY